MQGCGCLRGSAQEKNNKAAKKKRKGKNKIKGVHSPGFDPGLPEDSHFRLESTILNNGPQVLRVKY